MNFLDATKPNDTVLILCIIAMAIGSLIVYVSIQRGYRQPYKKKADKRRYTIIRRTGISVDQYVRIGKQTAFDDAIRLYREPGTLSIEIRDQADKLIFTM